MTFMTLRSICQYQIGNFSLRRPATDYQCRILRFCDSSDTAICDWLLVMTEAPARISFSRCEVGSMRESQYHSIRHRCDDLVPDTVIL